MSKYSLLFLLIMLTAGVIRFYGLGSVPSGMTWDEAAIGYNGFAIFETRRDEWLQRLPVSFMSFGDYKAPLAIYLNGPFTYLFGMNLFAVRLPFAIAGLISIWGIIKLTELIFKNNPRAKVLGLVAGALMTLSPWHIHFSRTGFESGIALAMIIWGLYFLIRSIEDNLVTKWHIFISALLFVLSLYTYHNAKVFVPLVLLLATFIYSQELIRNFKLVGLTLLFGIGLTYPLIKDALWGEGLTRAGVTIISKGYSLIEIPIIFLQNLAAHLSPSFLILGETTSLRHGSGVWGILFPSTLALVICGAIFLLKQAYLDMKSKKIKLKEKHFLFIGLSVILGLIPAAIATEIPHPNRALLAMPGFIFLAVYGLNSILQINSQKSVLKIFNFNIDHRLLTIGIIHISFFIAFIGHYFNGFARDSAHDFKDGYLEAFTIAHQYEDQVEKILFTSEYGQPYIFAIFVRQTNPIWYQGGSLIKYEFSDNINIGDLQRPNTLIITIPDDDQFVPASAQYIVRGSDDSIRFLIYKTNP